MAEPITTVKQGQLKGVTGTDLNDEIFYQFLGIPYAKPPVGPLRFKAPQPAEPWTGVRDASKEGSACLSMDLMTQKVVGSEDCLYLNVFTKQLPKEGLNSKPVMVFIHGGAFTMGSGSADMAGPKNLIAEDIVLVTINYRLGVFGFLSSDDLSLNIPGNAGLKDQTLALKWVQENISSFNGDPNNVTIFGVSAGGASVHFQVLSPTSKDLFHKAIAQSGSALNPWAWGQKNVTQVAEKLGKDLSNEKDAFDVLMTVSADELFEASQKITDVLLDSTKRRPFGPVIEKPNSTAFLSENPTDLLASGQYNQVPIILGATSNEGLISEFMKDQFFLNVKLNDMAAFWNWGLEENNQKHTEIKAKLNEFYFKDGETDEARQKIVGDVCFTIGVIESAKLAVKTSQNPVYLYIFNYEIELSKLTYQALNKANTPVDLKGVAHGEDAFIFLFSTQLSNSLNKMDPKIREETSEGIKKVTKIWADFARTGRPHELWEPVTDVNELKYFEINKESELKLNPFSERVAIWERVFKEAPPINAHIQESAAL